MAADYGYRLESKIKTDSTAALGIVHRRGVGRMRHVDVQYLWIQEKLRRKEIAVHKVGTDKNLSDFFTKAVAAENLPRTFWNPHFRVVK